jgi:hypothetical protein
MRAFLIGSVAVLALTTGAANAAAILTFGQTNGNPVTATANAAGTETTIVATDAPILLTELLGGVPGGAFLDLDIHSTDAAAALGGGSFQHYAGSFSITSLPGDIGTNFLSGSFTDIVVGVGPSAVLAAGSPPDAIAFTSDVIDVLSGPDAISLSFANLTPAFSIDNETIGSFTASVAGAFSGSQAVPEPSSLVLYGLSILGVAFVTRRKSARAA